MKGFNTVSISLIVVLILNLDVLGFKFFFWYSVIGFNIYHFSKEDRFYMRAWAGYNAILCFRT